MNHYKFGVKGQERKNLVSAISEILNQPTKYLGAPTFAYEIGGYHIDKEGMVTGEFNLTLFAALEQRGFKPDVNEYERQFMCSSQDEQVVDGSSRGVHHSTTFHLITPRGTLLCQKRFDTAEEAEAEGYGIYFHHEGRDVYIRTAPDGMTEHSKWFAVVGAPFEIKTEPAADISEPETDLVSIEMPLDGFTPEALDNLTKMVLAKESLLKKALDTDDLPIQIEGDRICFPWFRLHEDNGEIAAYSQLIAALCETAKEKKRVTAKALETFENEKFALRVWLIGLGLIGKEYSTVRKLLVNKRLSGNSSWRYGAPDKAAQAEVDTAEPDIMEEVPAAETVPAQAEVTEVLGDE